MDKKLNGQKIAKIQFKKGVTLRYALLGALFSRVVVLQL